MKVISPSEYEVALAANKMGLDSKPNHCFVPTQPIDIYQFASGNQGYTTPVASYTGAAFYAARIPRLIRNGCTSPTLVMQSITFALIDGIFYEVEYRKNGIENGKVSLHSDVKLFNENDPLIKMIEAVRATLNQLESELKNK